MGWTSDPLGFWVMLKGTVGKFRAHGEDLSVARAMGNIASQKYKVIEAGEQG